MNGRRFGFAAGIGVDSEAVRELDTIKRARDGRRPGDLAYARVVARRLLGGYEPRLEVEGLGRAALVFVSNDSVLLVRRAAAAALLARRRGSSSGSTSSRPAQRRPA